MRAPVGRRRSRATARRVNEPLYPRVASRCQAYRTAPSPAPSSQLPAPRRLIERQVRGCFLAAAILLLTAGCAEPLPTATPTLPPPSPTPAPTAAPVSYLQTATVQILAQTQLPSGPQTMWYGSGTIVSPDGLILTNAHVAQPRLPELAAMQRDLSLMYAPEPDALVVAVVEREDRPPVPRFVAKVVVADGILDLAVLRIAATVDGQPVEGAALGLPHVTLGDSDALQLGDGLRVLGFPGLGGETLTLTRGSVSGFVPQPLIGNRAWIKTDTAISPGNSGGLGSDDTGRLIGIPTMAAETTGGINLLRPANLARPLIEAARTGQEYTSPHAITGSGDEVLTPVAWAERVDEDGCAVEPVESYAQDAIGLAVVFSYRGMTDGQLVFADWTYAERSLNSDVWFWEGGERGSCFPVTFHDLGRPLDAGTYGLEVRVGPELRVAGRASVDVAGPTEMVAGTVQVEGVITDADSGRPVPGAVVLVFKPGVSASEWGSGSERSLDDIFTVGESDRNGRYRLLRRLERSVQYEVAADHPEYPLMLGVFDCADTPDNHTVDIELSR